MKEHCILYIGTNIVQNWNKILSIPDSERKGDLLQFLFNKLENSMFDYLKSNEISRKMNKNLKETNCERIKILHAEPRGGFDSTIKIVFKLDGFEEIFKINFGDWVDSCPRIVSIENSQSIEDISERFEEDSSYYDVIQRSVYYSDGKSNNLVEDLWAKIHPDTNLSYDELFETVDNEIVIPLIQVTKKVFES